VVRIADHQFPDMDDPRKSFGEAISQTIILEAVERLRRKLLDKALGSEQSEAAKIVKLLRSTNEQVNRKFEGVAIVLEDHLSRKAEKIMKDAMDEILGLVE